MHYAFTGPRQITPSQEVFIQRILLKYLKTENWHVGDAAGLDSKVRDIAKELNQPYTVYKVIKSGEKLEPHDFAVRSRRMIEGLPNNGVLVAFPNKSADRRTVPCKSPSGHGSGTWLTIAIAAYKQIPVIIHPLPGCDVKLPDWLAQEQLSLFRLPP